MLLLLSDYLKNSYSALNIFGYITFRSIFSCLTALAISFFLTPIFLHKLNKIAFKQSIRDDGPSSHLKKKNTPTMGGVMILISLLVSILIWGDIQNKYLWVIVATMFCFGFIGGIDDYLKIIKSNHKGLSAGKKILLQTFFSLIISAYIFFTTSTAEETQLIIPFFKDVDYELGVFGFITLSSLVIISSSNAVNLTDGLDGLAIFPCVLISLALGIFAYVAGHTVFSSYLGFPYIEGSGELVVILSAFVGSGLAFLWFNAYPAEVFMGDIGSLTIGAILGIVCVIIRQEFVFLIMSGLFVMETLSVIIQVLSFKLTRKRVFKMAPIHHHFEIKGWKENQVVVRFWIITIILILLALSSLKIR